MRTSIRSQAGKRLIALVGTVALAFGLVTPAAAASGRVSAQMSATTFTAAQASGVRLTYSFSSKSRHFGFALARRASGKWVKVRTVSKRGSFKGSHVTTVKKVFGSHAVTVGRYRLQVAGDANTVSLKFTIASGSTPPTTVVPKPGQWKSTSTAANGGMVSVTDVSFVVSADSANVTDVTFHFTFSGSMTPPFGHSCSGTALTYPLAAAPTPVENAKFSGPTGATGAWYQGFNVAAGGTGVLTGTFDSPTTAHGTAMFNWRLGGTGCMSLSGQNGPFDWSASLQ